MSPNESTSWANLPSHAYSDPIDGVEVLQGCHHIRRRPVLYIGAIDSRGLHHLIWELLSNSLDACVIGSRPVILIALLRDGGCKVIDNGPGFPVDPTTMQGKQRFELLCSQPGCTGTRPAYRLFAGLEGVGLKAVNALSRLMIVDVDNHGKTWRQEFQRGVALGPVVAVRNSARTGTAITFWPDPEIFPLGLACQFSWDVLYTRLREIAYFYPAVQFHLVDDRNGEGRAHIFHFPDGLVEYVRCLNRNEEAIHPNLFHFVESEEGQSVEIALQWTRSTKEEVRTYCNTHSTIAGGTHQTGFRAALTRMLTKLLREQGGGQERRLRDLGARFRRGLTAVIAVTLREPRFGGSTKDCMVNPEVESFVSRTFTSHFRTFLQRHPADSAAIVGKLQANLSTP